MTEDGQIPVATGWAVPIQWNGTQAGLPTEVAERERGGEARGPTAT